MSRLARLATAAVLACLCAPVLAQSQADQSRLDDFAVTQAPQDPARVDQLGGDEGRIGGSQAPSDRTVATAEAPPPDTALSQLTTEKQRADQTQLSRVGAAPDAARAAVSSTADSRPGGVTRLGGQDRCDPQLRQEELARCQRILELRAREFNAPAPPRLSAEQQLLAAQREDEQRMLTPEERVRLAARDEPDAELQSNQELASLYLRNQQTAQETSAEDKQQEQAAVDATTAQILNALQVQASGAALAH